MSAARDRLLKRAMLRQSGDLRAYDDARTSAMSQLAQESDLREKQRQDSGLKSITQLGAIGGGLIAAPFTGGTSLAATLALLGGGAAAGAGVGEAVRQRTTGAADDGFDLGDIGQEAAIAGALEAGTFGLGKTLGSAVRGGTAAKSKFADKISKEGARRFFGIQKAQAKTLSEAGINPETLGRKWAKVLGNSDERGLSIINDELNAAESIIQRATRDNGVIDINPFVNDLMKTRVSLARNPANANKVAQLDELIDLTKSQYGAGIPKQDALKVLRSGNESFGKAALDVTDKGAVRTNYSKQLTNFVRSQLKGDDAVNAALRDQQELILMREMLKNKATTDTARGMNLGRFEITRPGTFVEPVVGGDMLTRNAASVGSRSGRLADAISNVRPQVGATAATIPFAFRPESRQDVINMAAGQVPTPSEQAQPQEPNGLASTLSDPSVQQQLLLADLLDPNSRGSNISALKSIFELSAPQETPELGGEAQKRAMTAESGLRSLEILQSTAENDPGAFARATLPNPFGITGRLTGTSDVRAAVDNVVDVIARLRSGAAITEDEARRFASRLPRPGDDQETALRRIAEVRAELEAFATPTATQPDLSDVLLQAQGGF